MTILIGNIDKSTRFGNLPQLGTFASEACVPTSITNALLALGINELMQDPVAVRKRTSTPEHALASETPTAKSKGLCQTGHGDVRP
jgi:hypothetical protein